MSVQGVPRYITQIQLLFLLNVMAKMWCTTLTQLEKRVTCFLKRSQTVAKCYVVLENFSLYKVLKVCKYIF